MKLFVAGLFVGVALGVAGTLAWTSRGADVPAATIAPAPAPEATSPPEAVLGRARPARPAQIAVPESPSVAAASSVVAEGHYFETATLAELIAVLRQVVGDAGAAPKDVKLTQVQDAIADRFPGFVYPVGLIVFLETARKQRSDISAEIGEACCRGVETWPTDVALAEFDQRLRATDRTSTAIVDWIVTALRNRGVFLPTDSVKSLLRDPDERLRHRGLALAPHAAEVDASKIRELAAQDASETTRSAALYALAGLVVESKRLRPEDVADVVIAALEDPDEQVQRAARRSLVAAGPRGADAALAILAHEGEGEDANDLVKAVVADGRGRDVLDLRGGASLARHVAMALVAIHVDHPELVRDLMPRFAELRDAAAKGDGEAAEVLFDVVCVTVGPRAVAESAASTSLDTKTRATALAALCLRKPTRQEGMDLARRIAADRTEGAVMRNLAVDRLWESAPDEDGEAHRAEVRRFLEELLRDEKNDRVRAHVREALKG